MKKVRITENSKQALCLLFSVILLAGTVTGIILPLRETKEQLQERIRLMEKERLRYEAFASDFQREERQRQRKVRLLHLQQRLPLKLEDTVVVDSIYELARRSHVSVVKLRRTGEASLSGVKRNEGAGKRKNTVGARSLSGTNIERCDWDAEFSGTYFALLDFFQHLETTGGMARLSGAVIRSSAKEVGSVHMQGVLSMFGRSASANALPRTEN